MSATVETLPPAVCASWCWDGTGHASAWHQEDQWCSTEQLCVQLTREPLCIFGDEQWLDNLKVSLGRELEGVTHVRLSRNDQTAVQLSMAEAAELRDHLTSLLSMASVV